VAVWRREINLKESTERKAIGPGRSLASWGAAALLLGTAASAVAASLTQVMAASSISVFVGYADSARVGGEFPNPWNGSPNVTFDGCSPQAACTFDGGALRIRNDNTTSVSVDQVSVHIGDCLYTWSGARYPLSLAPGASLITTQRVSGVAAGCTGPEPSTFDSSDIPSAGTCTNDRIQPTVDVTIDGTTSSYTDTGQVLNTGGVDPGICSNGDESTQWVRIGSNACPGQTLSLAPLTQTDSVGTTATVLATLTDACGSPLSDVVVDFRVTAGPNAGATGQGVTSSVGAAAFTYSSLLAGTDSLQAAVTNAVGFTRTSNTATVTWTVEFAPGGGSFVIGNENAALGSAVYFWGSQWAQHNSQTGGPAPRSFKGFADQPHTPACGQGWTSDPGNSTPPPDGPLPTFMAVTVTSSAHQIGPEISGDIVAIVIVKTNRGYEPNPGHAARGVIVGVMCGSVPPAPSGVPQRPQLQSAPANDRSGSSLPGGATTPTPCQAIPRARSITLPGQACVHRNRS
jgi:hypothetical protein